MLQPAASLARAGIPEPRCIPALLRYAAPHVSETLAVPHRSAGQQPPWRVMPITADLAAQLGDLALNARVQIHDLAHRPDLNGR